MRMDQEKGWAHVNVEQYSFVKPYIRLFYIKMKMKGIPIVGLHNYSEGKATMLIKLLGLIPVVNGKGEKMIQGETVTVFNDMCILAPATLIDANIKWETMDDKTVKGTFNNKGIEVSAILSFNTDGQLVNFRSDDRFLSPDGKTYTNYPWSTPVSNYNNIRGLNLATYGEAIWHLDEKKFCYAKFHMKDIEYNCRNPDSPD